MFASMTHVNHTSVSQAIDMAKPPAAGHIKWLQNKITGRCQGLCPVAAVLRLEGWMH